jgi:hypothetical protein
MKNGGATLAMPCRIPGDIVALSIRMGVSQLINNGPSEKGIRVNSPFSILRSTTKREFPNQEAGPALDKTGPVSSPAVLLSLREGRTRR